MVGLEAMACETPVTATDVGGTREMIADGINGLLIPFGDEGALKTALIKMCSEPELRKRLARLARERVENEFNIERLTAEFHSALIGATAKASQAAKIDTTVRAVENS